MEPLAGPGLIDLDDRQLRRLVEDLERRQPPATLTGVGIRPDRRPWTYREIRQLQAAREELRRRQGEGGTTASAP